MKSLLISTAATLLIATASAQAADLAPMPVEPAAPIYLPFTWTGAYVGVHAGYAWGNEDDNLDGYFDDVVVPASSFDTDGFLGGVHAGYNVQFDSFVVGIEGDIDWTGIDGSHRFVGDDVSATLSLEQNWQASLRARAGFAFDRFLVYGTGGVAFTDADAEIRGTDGDGGFRASDSQTLVGWTVGLGAEYAFTDNIIGRLEVRYTDFGDDDFGLGNNVNVDYSQTAVMAGVSYKF